MPDDQLQILGEDESSVRNRGEHLHKLQNKQSENRQRLAALDETMEAARLSNSSILARPEIQPRAARAD